MMFIIVLISWWSMRVIMITINSYDDGVKWLWWYLWWMLWWLKLLPFSMINMMVNYRDNDQGSQLCQIMILMMIKSSNIVKNDDYNDQLWQRLKPKNLFIILKGANIFRTNFWLIVFDLPYCSTLVTQRFTERLTDREID